MLQEILLAANRLDYESNSKTSHLHPPRFGRASSQSNCAERNFGDTLTAQITNVDIHNVSIIVLPTHTFIELTALVNEAIGLS